MYPQQSVAEGFKKVDETLTIATKSIAELITVRGTINLDFHDVSKILKNGGVAIMSTGKASGQNRVNKAFEEAQAGVKAKHLPKADAEAQLAELNAKLEEARSSEGLGGRSPAGIIYHLSRSPTL